MSRLAWMIATFALVAGCTRSAAEKPSPRVPDELTVALKEQKLQIVQKESKGTVYVVYSVATRPTGSPSLRLASGRAELDAEAQWYVGAITPVARLEKVDLSFLMKPCKPMCPPPPLQERDFVVVSAPSR